jgi:hypothetical protein
MSVASQGGRPPTILHGRLAAPPPTPLLTGQVADRSSLGRGNTPPSLILVYEGTGLRWSGVWVPTHGGAARVAVSGRSLRSTGGRGVQSHMGRGAPAFIRPSSSAAGSGLRDTSAVRRVPDCRACNPGGMSFVRAGTGAFCVTGPVGYHKRRPLALTADRSAVVVPHVKRGRSRLCLSILSSGWMFTCFDFPYAASRPIGMQ